MQVNEVTRYERQGCVAVITVDSPPVNALSGPVRQGLHAGVSRALVDDEVRAIVLICAGRTFFAGADIREFGKPRAQPTLLPLLDYLEGASKPLIAAIHGTALGGGLELALVAHYRVAVPSAKCGLPEVKLGLLAGGGGTQRLPRLVGVEKALEMVTTGDPISASEAYELGLVDELVVEGMLREHAIEFAQRIVRECGRLRKVRDLPVRAEPGRSHREIIDAFRRANAHRFLGFLAPENNIRCIEAAVSLPFDEGIRRERALFEELMASSQSTAQRYLFFAERVASKVTKTCAHGSTSSIDRVGVVGSGATCSGIATVVLRAGVAVTLVGSSQEELERDIGVIHRNCTNGVQGGRGARVDKNVVQQLLAASLDTTELRDCDLIVDARSKQVDTQKLVFSELDRIAKTGALFASTSDGNLDEIAAATTRSQNVVGLSFASPAERTSLVEVSRSAKTNARTMATIMKFAKEIGRTAVVVGGVHRRSIGKRLLDRWAREAKKLVMEGAPPWYVDRVLHESGFQQLNGIASAALEQSMRDYGLGWRVERRAISGEEILDRYFFAIVNEGAEVLLDGMAARASDIDVVCVTGYGWPAYRGGPMFWAEQQGIRNVLNRLRELQARHGDDFKPSVLFERMIAEGRTFVS